MSRCDKLILRAEASPNNISFSEICELAECFGWTFKRQNGWHHIYENEKLRVNEGRIQNFQDVRGKAKPYQVRQLLKSIRILKNAD